VEEVDEEEEMEEEDAEVETGAAWYDSDDEKLSVSLTSSNRLRKLRRTEDEEFVNGKVYTRRLRQQFERIYSVPEWAVPPERRLKIRQVNAEEEDEDILPTDPLSALFQSSARLTQRSTTSFPDDRIVINALLPISNPVGDPRTYSLDLHPLHPLLLVGSWDYTLRIYSIDGKNNPLATSLKLPRQKIQSAIFHPSKNIVYATSLNQRRIFVWDLNTGAVRKISNTLGEEAMTSQNWRNIKCSPDGRIVGVQGAPAYLGLLSAESGQYLGWCKVEGKIADYTFTQNGDKAFVITAGGEVWEFETQTRSVVNRWRDEGGVSLTKVALSSNDRYLAIGSFSGVVTIYDLAREIKSPVKTLMNLTTPINNLAFSPDGQILVMAGGGTSDQLRVVHIPAFKVFPNWPRVNTPIGNVDCIAVGINGYLAVARDKGVGLWRFRDLS